MQANRGRFRRINAIIIKEFHQIVRDPSSIVLSFVLPLILLFLFGFGVSLDIDHLKIGLVLEDSSPDAISFSKSLTDSPYLDVKIAKHREELHDDIVKGTIRGIVVIPSYFSQFRYRQDTVAPIQVIADGSETNTANFVQNYVVGAWQSWLQQEAISKNLKGQPYVFAQPRFWYNEQLESRFFLVPGSLAIIMTLIGTLLTALVVAREWERGTMEALMATPVSIGELIIGKLIPYFILGMCSMVVCVLFSILLYDIPVRGSLILLAFVSACFLLCALGIGLLISTGTRSQFVASQIGIISSFLPSYILSGFIFEISSMPLPVRAITHLIPARYFVSSLQTLFLVGNVWKLILLNVLYMLVFAGIVLFITTKKTVKRLD